ncbi:hypothetical protein Y032_0258g468 [Ancylostoma ceylanicum]|uniref:Uncharacterized protein n=1 Tax=Ancylostoma ceylanicum TaxID=53326 RepID=A0A016SAQ9_9BILA|nr:hypothetical protein Y032_0258g468 [Ancylostoma ceylanicum]
MSLSSPPLYVGIGELLSLWEKTLEFPLSAHKRWKKVTMSNLSDRKIMWSLRVRIMFKQAVLVQFLVQLFANRECNSNMVNTLSAMPTAGVLGAGEQDKIHFEVSDSTEKDGKVEFSYGYIDNSIEQFNRRIYSSLKKKIHRLNVVFR